MGSAALIGTPSLAPAGRTISVIFWHLKRAARSIATGKGPHAAAVAADAPFYQDWLSPRMRQHIAKLAAGDSR